MYCKKNANPINQIISEFMLSPQYVQQLSNFHNTTGKGRVKRLEDLLCLDYLDPEG